MPILIDTERKADELVEIELRDSVVLAEYADADECRSYARARFADDLIEADNRPIDRLIRKKVKGWRNVTDLNGRPVEFKREYLAAMDPSDKLVIADRIFTRSTARNRVAAAKIEAEKNGSPDSSSGDGGSDSPTPS